MNRRVLIISTVGLIYDGITSVITSYLQAMDLSNLDVYVISTIKAEKNILKKIENLGCHIVELPSRRSETLSYFWRLISFIQKNQIDVVHAHGNSGTLAIEMTAAWLAGCKKRIAHSHNTRCDQVKADKVLRPIFNIFYTSGLACGEDAGRWLFRDKPFKVLKNGRDVKTYSYNEEVRVKMRKKYDLENRLVIGHVGGFYPQKNHNFLCEIYREIVKTNPEARLFMIGDGPLLTDVEQKCSDIRNNVIFTGNVDNVPDLLQAMDGMLLPSVFEGLPLVAIEWQINGLPCILSDNITKECALTNNVHFLSLTDSPKKWAEKIIKASINNNRAKSSIISVKQVRNAGFDIVDNARQLRMIYMS